MSAEITNVVVIVRVDSCIFEKIDNISVKKIEEMILSALQVPDERELMKYLYSKYNNIEEKLWHQLEVSINEYVNDSMFLSSVRIKSADNIVFVFKKYN